MDINISIEEEAVRSAIDAFLKDQPLPINHPLFYLLTMRIQRNGLLLSLASGTLAAETFIFDRLIVLMRRRLNRQHTMHNLSPVIAQDDLNTVYATLKADFLPGSVELKAASYLYHRVGRSDLDISIDEFEKFTGEDRRTLQRRYSMGIRRLTQDLIRYERHLKRKYRQTALRSKLPAPTAPDLVGRDTLVAAIVEQLTITNHSHHLMLYGPPGIGKSALALAVAHTLIDQIPILPLSDVAWIEVDETTTIFEQLHQQLGLPLPEISTPCEWIVPANFLVVLDNAQALLEKENPENIDLLAPLLRVLGTAIVILCVQTPDEQFARLAVPELNKIDALTLLETSSQKFNIKFNQKEALEYFATLQETLGGNPGALIAALLKGKASDLSTLAGSVYWQRWQQSSQLEQYLWAVLILSPNGQLNFDLLSDMLLEVAGENDLNEAISALKHSGVLTATSAVTADSHYIISLVPLARTFLRSLVKDNFARTVIEQAAYAIAQSLGNSPDLERSLCLMDSIQNAQLYKHISPDFQLDLAYTTAPMIEKNGAWSAWVRYLEGVRGFCSNEHCVWIDLHIGIARRWLAQWKASFYALANAIESAGMAGLFDVQANAMLELAAVYRQLQDFTAATELTERAANRFHHPFNREGVQRALAEQVRLALAQQQIEQAAVLLDALEAYAIEHHALRHDKPTPETALVYMLQAQYSIATNQFESALYYAKLALRAEQGDDQEQENLPQIGRVLALLGQIYHRVGKPGIAIEHLLSAMNLMERTEDRLGYARARINLASVYLGMGNLRTALTYLRELPAQLEQLHDEEGLRITLANLKMLTQISHQWRKTG